MKKTSLGLLAALVPLLVVTPAGASPGPQPAQAAASVPAPRDVAYPGLIRLDVDATDVGHRIFDVHETVPVVAGPFTLLYPQWIPGHHSPTGPIDKLAGLTITAHGKPLEWRRDPTDVYAFHVEVPEGVSELDLRFRYLSPQDKRQGRVVMSPEMVDLEWNPVALYPAGWFGRDIRVQASARLPEGWQLATALTVAGRDGDRVRFEPIDFENLVDSPVLAGKYFRRFDLDPGAKTPVYLDVFADEASELAAKPEQIEAHRELVRQMYRVYGARHYDHYDFLVALSDKLGGTGLEHHRSSEDATTAKYFTKWDEQWLHRDLFAHEFNHSWDGKYRRPEGLWTPNFNVTKRDDGLWVYEGQTQFWGDVMAARSGLWSREQALAALAQLGARYDRGRPGLSWRSIQDTTNDPTIAQRAPLPYRSYQLSEDYYSGGQLIWFAVDARLRRLTEGRRSLDDFARAFFGMHDGAWDISTYSFQDVVDTLNGLASYDWKNFLASRLDGHGNLAQGLEDEGWSVVYTDQPSIAEKAYEAHYHRSSFVESIGLEVNDKGELYDVLWDGPAFAAGLAPGMTLIAVDHKAFTPETLADAIVAAKDRTEPIELTVKNFDELETLRVDYHGGPRYPHLERIPGTPDYLSAVLAPRK